MCGRASLPNDVSELKQDLRIEWDKLGDYQPRWNAAPTSDLPVVTSSPDGGRTLHLMRWGLIPPWAKDGKIARTTFNARAEGIDRKPAFRNAWKAGRRYLVVAERFIDLSAELHRLRDGNLLDAPSMSAQGDLFLPRSRDFH